MARGYDTLGIYKGFQKSIDTIKEKLLAFLSEANNSGKSVVGYGAPAKGNTLLNYAEITTNLLKYTVDISPHKQNKYLPGVHIPIYDLDKIKETKPDFVFILPWNIKNEITETMSHIREWGGQFVVLIPELEIIK